MLQPRQVIARILSWGGLLAGSLVLLALSLFTIGYLASIGDERLTPEAQALLQMPLNPYRAQDNIYLALAGFDAPAGELPGMAGQARIDRYNQNLENALRAAPGDTADIAGVEDPRRLEFRGDFDFSEPLDSYWNDVPAHRDGIERLLADNSELYERYRALHRQRGYFETARPSVLAPPIRVPDEVRTLFLADVVLKVRGDDADRQGQGLSDLESDVKLWRAVLTGEGTLASKMAAIGYLHADQLLMAEIIADPYAPVPTAAPDADVVAPLFALADWDLGSAYRAEFRVQEALLQQVREQSLSAWASGDEGGMQRWLDVMSHRIDGQFFKLNATENLFAERAVRLTGAAAAGATREIPLSPSPTLRMVYNPIGRILLSINTGSYEGHLAQPWDGAAFQRLLRLSYEIRRQRIEPAAIAEFMKAHPEWSTHPREGRPFVWDESAGTIRVPTQDRGSRGRRFFVRVWQEPSGL